MGYYSLLHPPNTIYCAARHTHQTAQPLFVHGTILLLCQLAAPVQTHCRIKQTFKEPVQFLYSTYVDSKWTQRFVLKQIADVGGGSFTPSQIASLGEDGT